MFNNKIKLRGSLTILTLYLQVHEVHPFHTVILKLKLPTYVKIVIIMKKNQIY